MEVIKKIQENPAIQNGQHLLTGVEPIHFEDDFYEEYDGYAIELDGEIYFAYEDPSDGYRSYAGIRKAFPEENFEITNRFEPQLVVSDTCLVSIPAYDDCSYEQERCQFTLKNLNGGTVFEVVTDWTDSYYPVGWVKYAPEMLPSNLDRLLN